MEQTSCHVVSTNSSVLNSTTLLASPSHPNKVEAKKVPLVGKIPVVISEADVQVYVDATIQLEEPALEITRVTKNVFLTRCQLLLTDDKKSSKLLISGFVRKNVEYSTAKHVGNTSVSGDIHFTVVKIPFKCFTKVDFITEPVTAFNPQIITSSAMSADGMGSDQLGISITNSEILNEKIYCELIESKIREIDTKKDIESLTHSSGKNTSERTFKTFIESMVIELKLRVLQNQSVHISPMNAGSQQGEGKNDGKGNGEDSGKGSDCKDGDKENSKDKEDHGEDKDKCDKSDKNDEGKKNDDDKGKKDDNDKGEGKKDDGGKGEGRDDEGKKEDEGKGKKDDDDDNKKEHRNEEKSKDDDK